MGKMEIYRGKSIFQLNSRKTQFLSQKVDLQLKNYFSAEKMDFCVEKVRKSRFSAEK